MGFAVSLREEIKDTTPCSLEDVCRSFMEWAASTCIQGRRVLCYPANGKSMFLRNLYKHLPDYVVHLPFLINLYKINTWNLIYP
jgi:hypothetical protein